MAALVVAVPAALVAALGLCLRRSPQPSRASRARAARQRKAGHPDNRTMIEAFEWHQPGGGGYWNLIGSRADEFAAMGVSAVWLPPPTKAHGGAHDVGYAAYDLWDLGEFDQKGTVGTKWGTKKELVAAIAALRSRAIDALVDGVLNHRMGADGTETFLAQQVEAHNRRVDVGEPGEVEAWTAFDFSGRGGEYSPLRLRKQHFTGLDWDQRAQRSAIFRIEGKKWSERVSDYLGNFDYLMGCDVDYSNEQIASDTIAWGEWIIRETGFAGFRLDAVKSIDEDFISRFVREVRQRTGRAQLFVVGEYWDGDVAPLEEYIDTFGEQVSMFDAPLHYNFFKAGQAGSDFDLRTIFDRTLVRSRPENAVTLVDNHDTQPGQESASYVSPTFKPLAYALILLREEGYPCVFAGDLYGLNDEARTPAMPRLAEYIKARRYFAYGETTDYWKERSTVGWVRAGDGKHEGCAVVVNIAPEQRRVRMKVARGKKGERWVDVLGNFDGEVRIGRSGWGEFGCEAGRVSVWVRVDSDALASFRSGD